MTNFERMWGKLPYVMRQENNEKLYRAMGNIFDDFDTQIALYENMHVVDLASGSQLDAIGYNIGVARVTGQSDETYRRRLKIFYSSVYFIPTLDNFQYIIKNIMGYYPMNVKEGWKYKNESGLLELDVIIPEDDTDAVITDLDRLYSYGCRVIWNKYRRVKAAYNYIGDINTCGFTEIFHDLETINVPYDGFSVRYDESIGDENTTGFQDLNKNPYHEQNAQPL